MDTHNRSGLLRPYQSKRILIALFLAASVMGLWAQSGGTDATSLYFPRFISGAGTDSGLALFNPTRSDATASLTLIDASGTPSTSVSVVVPALGRVAQTGSELFGNSVLNASLRVTSSTAGLGAMYSTFDSAGNYMDGTDTAQSNPRLTFPVAPGSATKDMEIVLRNPTTRGVAVKLMLWNLSGSSIGSASVTIAPSASIRSTVGSLMPSVSDFSSASHLTAWTTTPALLSGQQPIYGTSVFAGAMPVLVGTDVAALNALTLTQAATAGVLPYYRVGSSDFSVVSIANIEPVAVNVTVTALRNNGSTVATRAVSLNGNGGVRESVRSLFPELASGDHEGWILVQASGRIAANLLYGRSEGGALSALPLQATPQYQLVFPQAIRDEGYYTEISIVDPGPDAGDADVYVVDADGTTLAANRIHLTAGERTSFRLDQIMPERFQGLVSVVSTVPVFASSSVWTTSGRTVSNIPAVTQFTGYQPAVPQTAAVIGTVLVNSSPVEGARVVISGPVGKVTATAEDGSYGFTGLPPGRYSLAVDQYGFQFIPAVANFEIARFGVRQDFVGFTQPNSILVVPASVPVASADVTAQVLGADFNATSQAFVKEATRLQTTYVDPNRLEIVIPAWMAEKASTYEIYVVTNGSSSSPQVTQTYPVVVFLDRPTLSAATTAGDVMEGSQGAVLNLTGTGFLPGLKVKVNGQSDSIEVNLVSDTQAVAKIPASYLAIGGIYPVTVVNPFPSLNAESNIQLMTVYFPTPGVQRIDPVFTHVQMEDSRMMQLDVFGYQFRRGAVVMFETDQIKTTPLPTVYCETTPACLAEHLTATIPAGYLQYSAFAKITVQNPVPFLKTSEVMFLRIDCLQPTITEVIPGSATIAPVPPIIKPCPPENPDCQQELFRMIMPVVVNGTNITPQTLVSIDRMPGTPPGGGGVVFVGPTQLYVSWEVTPNAIGTWYVQILNPEPGACISEPMPFVLTQGNFVQNPFLLTISPTSVSAGGPSFTLTVTGVNFKTGSQINFSSTNLVTTFVSSTELRAEVPAYLVKDPGKRPVSVTNPDPGGTSNRLFIEVN